MENNGKANAMETLKALKESFKLPYWPLVGLALFLAVPISGGTLALVFFLSGASPLLVVMVLVGLASYAFVLYMVVYGFLKKLDQRFVALPVHSDEGVS